MFGKLGITFYNFRNALSPYFIKGFPLSKYPFASKMIVYGFLFALYRKCNLRLQIYNFTRDSKQG